MKRKLIQLLWQHFLLPPAPWKPEYRHLPCATVFVVPSGATIRYGNFSYWLWRYWNTVCPFNRSNECY
jgi:hypothetical protein